MGIDSTLKYTFVVILNTVFAFPKPFAYIHMTDQCYNIRW